MHSDVLPIVRSQVTSGGLPLSALRQTSGRRGVLFVHTTVHTHMFTLYHRVHGSRNKRVIAVVFRLLCLSNIYTYIYIHNICICLSVSLSLYIYTYISLRSISKPIYIYLSIHTRMHACIHPSIHACMHAYMHTYVYTPSPSFFSGGRQAGRGSHQALHRFGGANPAGRARCSGAPGRRGRGHEGTGGR